MSFSFPERIQWNRTQLKNKPFKKAVPIPNGNGSMDIYHLTILRKVDKEGKDVFGYMVRGPNFLYQKPPRKDHASRIFSNLSRWCK